MGQNRQRHDVWGAGPTDRGRSIRRGETVAHRNVSKSDEALETHPWQCALHGRSLRFHPDRAVGRGGDHRHLDRAVLPAVQQARESGRRVSCVSNLRQLGIALHNYEAANKQLPAAGTYAPVENTIFYSYAYWRIDLKSGTNYSWVVSLLPYMEEQNLFDRFDLKTHVTANPQNPQSEQPAMLLCPSDDARGRQFELASAGGDGTTTLFGKANYAAFANVYHIDSWFYPASMRLYGQKLRQIRDGTSSTLVFAEIRTRDNQFDQRGAWALPWSGSTLLSFDFHPTAKQESADRTAGDYVPNKLSLGATQYPNGPNPDVLYECPESASAVVRELAMQQGLLWLYLLRSAQSAHWRSELHISGRACRISCRRD